MSETLHPGWPAAVQEVLEEGVGMLDIPNRTVNALEEQEILSIEALLMVSLNELNELIPLGDKSFTALKLALQKKGFRRARGTYDPDQPLWTLYKGCLPANDDPADLVANTEVVDKDEPKLLSHKKALERAITGLEDVMTYYGKKTKQYKMLQWIVYYAKTRLPEPKDG